MSALEHIAAFAGQTGFRVIGHIPSPITGAGGNEEFLLFLQATKENNI
jgi:predicted rRNA methylase YqxC with S4 and FtsJ domains